MDRVRLCVVQPPNTLDVGKVNIERSQLKGHREKVTVEFYVDRMIL